MEALARKGVLYFNLHTKGHEFYGEMRGQIYPVEK
jgi:CHRD domain